MKKVLWTVFFIIGLPLLSQAELAFFFDVPDTIYPSNTVVDVIEHDGGVWFASGDGLNFSFDEGTTWLKYNDFNGLISNNVSAIYSAGSRLWIASSHDSLFELSGETVTLAWSDGLSYTDDDGNTWARVDYGSLGSVYGVDRTIFDITGHYDADRKQTNGQDMDWLFTSAFAGGFLASQDGGMSWRRIYASSADSINFNTAGVEPSLRNRNFACVADTSHGDTLFIWSGTAAGVFQYIYAKPTQKPYSKSITSVAFCDTCSNADSIFMFLGGDRGVIRGLTTGGPWITRFEDQGLPGSYITDLYSFKGRLLVGTVDTSTELSAGLAYSDDIGDSYSFLSGFIDVVGGDAYISDFNEINDRIYLAGSGAGLFVSADSGMNWNKILIDSTVVDSSINNVNSLDVTGDTLWLGTDNGFVSLVLQGDGTIDSMFHLVFPEDDTSSTKIIRIRAQQVGTTTVETDDDTLVIWTINRSVDPPTGAPFVGRSVDGGQSFRYLRKNQEFYDVAFVDDTAFLADVGSLLMTRDGGYTYQRRYIRNSGRTASLDNDTIFTIGIHPDSNVLLGASGGFAISNEGFGFDVYRITRGNVDTLGADVVVNYNFNNTLLPVIEDDVIVGLDTGITGNFVRALGIQNFDDGSYSHIWVSGTRALDNSEFNGISVGYIGPIRDSLGASVGTRLYWDVKNNRDFAWNFGFSGDSVFAATDAGLLMYVDTISYDQPDTISEHWDTLNFVNGDGVILVDPGTPVYGVEVIDSLMWVATNDGVIRVNLKNPDDQQLMRRVDSTFSVYAYPVPYSFVRHGSEQKLDITFHFNLRESGEVTVEVYDFAMNLVARPIDNMYLEAGPYPRSSLGRAIGWDGTRGNSGSEKVAVGVYYFKVIYPDGNTEWGKLAIIP